MKIKQLVELLQKFDPEDRICIKAWTQDENGKLEKHFLRITGIDDDLMIVMLGFGI